MRSGILGTGLIGGSIGLGLGAAGWHVTGWDPDEAVLVLAAGRGCVVPAARSEILEGDLDLVVLAAPPGAVVADVAEVATSSLVVDVTGVKAPIVSANRIPRFVGTHPMAGREVAGPGAASAALFRGAAWVVVTDGAHPDDVAEVEEIVELLGARPVRMTAAEHDVAVAVVSHLPQLLASALMNEAADRTDVLELVAGSFRDLTRVAASDPAMWVELLDANRSAVLEVLDEYVDRLRSLARRVASRDTEALAAELDRARAHRRALIPSVAAVRVALADQPGELAKVGRAFARAAVDVRDLQLRHSPFGGGGVLTVSVRTGDEKAMEQALVEEGLLLAD